MAEGQVAGISTPVLVGGAVLLIVLLFVMRSSTSSPTGGINPVTLAPPPDPGVQEAQIQATSQEFGALASYEQAITLGQQAQTTTLELAPINAELEQARINATLDGLKNTNQVNLDIAKAQAKAGTNKALLSSLGSDISALGAIFGLG